MEPFRNRLSGRNEVPIHSTIYSVAYCPWRGTLKTTTLLYEECIIYTVADNFGNIQGVIKDVNDTGITVENKQGLQAVNLDYVVRIREYPRKKNRKEKSVVF